MTLSNTSLTFSLSTFTLSPPPSTKLARGPPSLHVPCHRPSHQIPSVCLPGCTPDPQGRDALGLMDQRLPWWIRCGPRSRSCLMSGLEADFRAGARVSPELDPCLEGRPQHWVNSPVLSIFQGFVSMDLEQLVTMATEAFVHHFLSSFSRSSSSSPILSFLSPTYLLPSLCFFSSIFISHFPTHLPWFLHPGKKNLGKFYYVSLLATFNSLCGNKGSDISIYSFSCIHMPTYTHKHI